MGCPDSSQPVAYTKLIPHLMNGCNDAIEQPQGHAWLRRLLGCDVYSFDFKINHIARHIQLPNPPHLGPGAKSLSDAEQIPPLLVLNIQLPMYPVSFTTS